MSKLSMKDMFMNIFLHWKRMLIFMLVLGILGAGYGYYKAKKWAGYVSDPEKTLTAERRAELDAIALQMAGYHTVYVDDMLYLEKSLLMNVDAAAVPSIKLTYNVKYDKYDNTYDNDRENMVLVAYMEKIKSRDFIDRVFGEFEDRVEKSFCTELISYGNVTGSTLSITITFADKEGAVKVGENADEAIMSYIDEIRETCGDFELNRIDMTYNENSRNNLVTKKAENLTEMRTAKNNANNLITYFTADELKYTRYAELKALDESKKELVKQQFFYETEFISDDGTAVSDSINIKTVIKWAMVLLMAGLMLSAGIDVIRYVFTKRLRNAEDMVVGFAVPLIGCVTYGRLKGLSKKILSTLRNGQERASEELTDFYACELVKIAENSGLDTIVLGTTLKDNEIAGELIGSLKKKISGSGMRAESFSGIRSSSAISMMSEKSYVCMIELQGESRYSDIAEFVDICDRCSVKQLGAIVADER